MTLAQYSSCSYRSYESGYFNPEIQSAFAERAYDLLKSLSIDKFNIFYKPTSGAIMANVLLHKCRTKGMEVRIANYAVLRQAYSYESLNEGPNIFVDDYLARGRALNNVCKLIKRSGFLRNGRPPSIDHVVVIRTAGDSLVALKNFDICSEATVHPLDMEGSSYPISEYL